MRRPDTVLIMDHVEGEIATPSAARIYDAVLGGTFNYEIDRAAANRLIEIEPDVPLMAWANRGFLQRVAGWLPDAGINQVVDIGAGLPTVQNTHQIVGPDCRVAYVDHDPEVVRLGREMLVDTPNAVYVQGDVATPEFLDDPMVRSTIDLSRPVALLIVGVLYFVGDEAKPHDAVRRLLDAVPSGSYLALSHLISDRQSPQKIERASKVYESVKQQLHLRAIADVTRFFESLEIVPPYPGAEPKLDYIGSWGAENPAEADDDASRWFIAGVGRKP